MKKLTLRPTSRSSATVAHSDHRRRARNPYLPPYYHPGPDDEREIQYCSSAAANPRRLLPERRTAARSRSSCPTRGLCRVLKKGSGKQAVATTMAFVRLLKDLMRDKDSAAHRADHPRRGPHVRHGLAVPDAKIYNRTASSTPPSTAI
jgi:pyruvate dehydrogenase E1 component